jgi:tripartite-type tricarboxylate transporter receptor subunit TctC
MMKRIAPVLTLPLAAVMLLLPMMSVAQTYPNRLTRLILGFPPGGGTDIIARLLAQKLTEGFGQQVIVDNRPGANSNLAAELVAKAPADGYTIFLITGGLAVNKALYRNLNYDIERDFAPVIAVGSVPQVVSVHPSLPVKSVAELAAFAKSRPGQIVYASAGTGSVEHIAAEIFASMAGVKLLHVQYKGGGPAALALLSGEVAVGFNVLPAVLPFIKNGRIRGLAVTGERRSSILPEYPTVAQSGLPGYEASVWYGVLAPNGTPREIVAKLNTELNRIIGTADVRERLAVLGADTIGGSPEAFGTLIRNSVAKYTKVVRDSDIRVE